MVGPTSVLASSAVLTQRTEIPSSVSEPGIRSCRLYDGGHVTGNQVTVTLVSTSAARCDFAQQLCGFVTSSAIHLHSSPNPIPDGCTAFSQHVHHSSFTAFAALGGLITPPEQRYRYFNHSLRTVCIISNTACHSLFDKTVTSRHKQRPPREIAICHW
jgi:hypothetical protein